MATRRGKTPHKQKPATFSKTISAEELCEFTGLTDRRHRQLADAKYGGYYPTPIKSQYQLEATFRGLFRYYREVEERRRGVREKLDQAKLQKLELENKETAGDLVDRKAVCDELSRSLIEIREALRHLLEEELPMSLATLDVPSARIISKRHFDKLCQRIQALFVGWKV